MVGRIVWYSEQRTQGLVSVTNERGEVTSYFMLLSKIVKRPEKIQAGNYVKFHKIVPATRQGLLPLAVDVVVSEHALVDAGVNALAATQKTEVPE
jgi:hypothetical protein